MAQQPRNKYQEQNVRLPLLGSMTNRNSVATKDQRFINIFPETREVEAIESTRIFLNKRPGLSLYKDFGDGTGRGLAYFRKKIYAVIDGNVYEDGSPPTSIITLTDTTSKVGMIVANSTVIGDYLFICDGTAGWIVKQDGSVVQITSVDFPTPHIPIPTYIDGYLLLAKGSDVYNCVLDDPTTWNSGEYLSAEMFPDPIVGLARQNNQVVVFGESAVEFFYDAGNVSGSPLSRNDSTILQVGCAFPYAIYQNENTFMFTGQSESGGRAVWQVEGFKPTKISDVFIDRILDQETDPLNVHGYGFRTMGHLFYLLNLPTLNRTLVYDIEEKLWHEWSTNTTGVHSVFAYNYMCDIQTGSAYVLHSSTGCVYKIDPTVYLDDSAYIIVDITTNKHDMDTYKRKFMRNMRLVGDRSDSVYIRWSDDDYQTWSNIKTVALNDDFPNFARLGSFRRRAFNIRHNTNSPLRLESMEVSFYEGDS